MVSGACRCVCGQHAGHVVPLRHEQLVPFLQPPLTQVLGRHALKHALDTLRGGTQLTLVKHLRGRAAGQRGRGEGGGGEGSGSGVVQWQ